MIYAGEIRYLLPNIQQKDCFEKQKRENKRNTWGTRRSTLVQARKTGMEQPYNKNR